jgi:hypothetical protein
MVKLRLSWLQTVEICLQEAYSVLLVIEDAK